jgi:MSHA biogenesis protein MshP
MTHIRPKQHGFAAIAAIFIVVGLAALGGFMLTFSSAQQVSSVQDQLGSRAYWAARAGIEWGIASTGAACPASPTTLAVDNFGVLATCAAQTYTEAGNTVTIFRYTSVATSAAAVGSLGFVERSLSASMER